MMLMAIWRGRQTLHLIMRMKGYRYYPGGRVISSYDGTSVEFQRSISLRQTQQCALSLSRMGYLDTFFR